MWVDQAYLQQRACGITASLAQDICLFLLRQAGNSTGDRVGSTLVVGRSSRFLLSAIACRHAFLLELTKHHSCRSVLRPLLQLSHFYVRTIMRPYVVWEIPPEIEQFL